ncbi:MAG: hypothetical protein HUJ54_11355 [Erysipelotrichaceae bacterium]|nr:hypothetical protein [Erysipelotrichaceae bacterium]
MMNKFMKGLSALMICLLSAAMVCSLIFSGCSTPDSAQVQKATNTVTKTADEDVKQDFKDLNEETQKSIEKDSKITEETMENGGQSTQSSQTKTK